MSTQGAPKHGGSSFGFPLNQPDKRKPRPDTQIAFMAVEKGGEVRRKVIAPRLANPPGAVQFPQIPPRKRNEQVLGVTHTHMRMYVFCYVYHATCIHTVVTIHERILYT